MTLLLIGIGMLAGALFGLIGTGAGLIIIPALIYLAHFSEKQAIGTSIVLLLPPIGFFAALAYYQAGDVNLRAAMFVIAGFLVGSFVVGRFAPYLPDVLIARVFGLVAILIGIKMLFYK